MSKRKTISTRWTEWTNASPLDHFLARATLITLSTSLAGLMIHLWILKGFFRTAGLITMIAMVVISEAVMIWRATKHPTVWWWVAFWAWIVASVIGFEIASYFFGS
jgi:hypothetical protein